jgi:hypothetical protein
MTYTRLQEHFNQAADRLTAPTTSNYEQQQLDRLAPEPGELVVVKFATDQNQTKWLSIPVTMLAQIRELFGTLPK